MKQLPTHITITWATWLLGSALSRRLLDEWHQLTIVGRSTRKITQMYGESVRALTRDQLSPETLDWCEVCIHLAGKSIISLPWTQKNKNAIRNSRIHTTKNIVDSLPDSCHTLLCASATGYYPSDDHKIWTIDDITTDPSNLLSQLCVARESAAAQARTPTRRVVHIRTGLVTGAGGFEDKVIKATKRWGWVVLWSGQQWMPLVTKHDWVDNVITCIQDNTIHWAINNVSRNIQYRDYIREVAHKLRRPTRLRMPSWILRLVLWEAALLFLWSWKVQPFGYWKQLKNET